jgi:ATP-dependent DNA helicase RecG
MHPDPVAAATRASVSEVGRLLLRLPEDQWFDRKSATLSPERLATHLVGMANADGGTVVIGLSDGKVQGTDRDPRRRNSLTQAAADFTDPPVRIHHRLLPCIADNGEQDHLLIIEIAPSGVVHATNRDEVYLRVGDETRRLTFTQRQELVYDKGQSAFEATPVAGETRTSLRDDLVFKYAHEAGARDGWRLLAARGLIRGEEVTVAGYLLFGDHPQTQFPNAHLRVLRWRGVEPGVGARQQLLSDVRCEGPLGKQIEKAAAAVRAVAPTRRALLPTGRFGPVGLIPEDAWLEGIVNAVVHRSYSNIGDHVRINVFDDRIQIESPGRFPGIARLDDPLAVIRFARNPRIARACSDLGFGQEFGEGIRRMFEEMRLAGLDDPAYRQTSGSVILTLSAAPAHQALDRQLPVESRAVVALLRAHGRLGTGQVAEALGLSRPVAGNRLTALRDAGIVEWVGRSPRDPRAFWQLRTA